MALQTSGAISLNDMHVEAGGTSGTEVSLNDADIRDLISKGAGAQARFSEWYGAAREYAFSIVDDVANADVRALAISDGWDGNEPLVVNVTSGTTVYSTTTSTGGMVVAGSFPNGITINNSGAITGRGGSAGQDGGDALEITTTDSVTVTNNSGAFIAGGGVEGHRQVGAVAQANHCLIPQAQQPVQSTKPLAHAAVLLLAVQRAVQLLQVVVAHQWLQSHMRQVAIKVHTRGQVVRQRVLVVLVLALARVEAHHLVRCQVSQLTTAA